MEYWDLCDEKGSLLGQMIERGAAHPPGTYHLVVYVWIMNSRDELLLTLRSKEKKQYPGMWEGLGGSVLAGEQSREAIVREVHEEIGLDFAPQAFKLAKRLREKTALVDIYELRADFLTEELKLQPEEVDLAKWAGEEELARLIGQGRFSKAAQRRLIKYPTGNFSI